MKKVLITGSSGFIGRNLTEYLSAEYCVLAPRHQELDLLDAKKVEEYLHREHPEYVIHSAVQGTLGLPDIYKTMVLKNNLQMFFHLKRCSECYEKMYYFGSGAEYGKDVYIPNMQEQYFDTTVPQDDYGLSKYIMAKSVKDSENIYDLRLFGVFGQHENYNYRFISNCICKALKNRDIVIHQNVYFDYLYIKDLCNIMGWFLGHQPKEHFYNVCTGHAVDIYSIAKIVVQKTNSMSKIIVENGELGKEYSGSNQRLQGEMSEYIFTEIDTAVEEMIQFYQNITFELSGDY